MFAFLALLFILLVIYFFTAETEGFSPLNIPSDIPPVKKLDLRVKPFDLPGQLPVAPYQQIATMSPLPYQDTALIKANRQQLINQLELLKGFLAFEAQEIAERSDPSIQLPLSTARSDFHTLQREVEVLNRNPGLQPTITLSHLNEISSNLAYLQSKVRLIGSAGSLQGPEYPFKEGFANIYPYPKIEFRTEHVSDKNSDPKFKIYAYNPGDRVNVKLLTEDLKTDVLNRSLEIHSTNKEEEIYSGNESVFKDNNKYVIVSTDENKHIYYTFTYTKGSNSSSSSSSSEDREVATKIDLENFIKRITAEILKLNQSGTTDPVVDARMNALTNMKSNIQTILNNVIAKTLSPENIPIMKSSIDKAFPLGDMSKPLPMLIESYGLPKWLSALLPENVSNDPEITGEIKKLINNYADTIANGLSASFTVKYNPKESTVDSTGFPSITDLDNVNNPYTPEGSEGSQGPQGPQGPQGQPSHFNWKERAKQIEAQIKKRGLNPNDFGVMSEEASNDFSWKGYTRMLCTRLEATMDPSLPETCGCPPKNWKGWKISH